MNNRDENNWLRKSKWYLQHKQIGTTGTTAGPVQETDAMKARKKDPKG